MIQKILISYLLMALVLPGYLYAEGPKPTESKKKVEYRKTQKVDFDGSDVDGQVRTPDGNLMIEKRGVQFLPMYQVTNQADQNILESVEYLR